MLMVIFAGLVNSPASNNVSGGIQTVSMETGMSKSQSNIYIYISLFI